MTRLLWAAGWVGVFFWSVFALATYGFVDLLGGVFMRNADMFSTDPGTVEWLFGLFGWVRSFSTGAILVIWGLVSLAILAVPWLVGRLAAAPAQGPHSTRPPVMRDGVIDLGPTDYTIRNPDPSRRGPTPSIGPRR